MTERLEQIKARTYGAIQTEDSMLSVVPTQDWEWLITEAEKYERLAKAINEDSAECLPNCDSYGHQEGCPVVEFDVRYVQMAEKVKELENERDQYKRQAEVERAGYKELERECERLKKSAEASRYADLTCRAKGCDREVHPFCQSHDWGDR